MILFQIGILDVVVPPDFIMQETSGDTSVSENGLAVLTCRASGRPEPHIQWRREDGRDIIIRSHSGTKTRGKRELFFKRNFNLSVIN